MTDFDCRKELSTMTLSKDTFTEWLTPQEFSFSPRSSSLVPLFFALQTLLIDAGLGYPKYDVVQGGSPFTQPKNYGCIQKP